MKFKVSNSKTSHIILLISFFLVTAFSALASNPASSLSSKLQDIESVYKSDSQQALNLAKELSVEFPENAKVIYWLARLYPIYSEFELGYKYATNALELNISAHDKTYMYLTLAYYSQFKQNIPQQYEYLEQAIDYAKKTEDPELIVEMLSVYSGTLASNNRVDQAMDYMTQSYELVDNVSSPDALSTMYNALCTIYLQTGHPDGAIEAMLKSIEYVMLTENTQQLSVAYYNLADIYIQTEDYEQAINAYKNSERYSRNSGDIIGIAYAYMGMGRSYLHAKQYDQALTVLLDAKQRFLPENHIGNLIQIYGDLASVQLNLKMYEDAQDSLAKLEALKPYKTERSFETYVQSAETQANVFFALGKIKEAYQVQQNYIDQLRSYHKQQLEISRESVFEKLKNSIYAKDNQLLILENQLKKVELDKHKKQTDLLILTSLFSICIAIFVTFILSRNIRLQKQLDKLATTDDLTGLYNRRKIMAILSQRFNDFKKSKQSLYVCMFDLDLFKNINDQFGHVMGDAVLKHIADCAINIFGEAQPVGRYGGEEFLIILNSKSYQAAHAQLEEFRLAIEDLDIPGLVQPVTISLGLSEASINDAYQTDIIQRADTALYDAKKSGRNRLCGK
ncbi:diguanylate cyclase [Psychrosphaera sp. F3M07]|uniref:tetratricopeptide repeat-containing diguanylate cyclase n=1 Tax=Psychrosphaera sp. F3M07 TaxID=2841560 RepID=UPI001C08F1A5|nr:GGDEF domain-containing protein [Psychrosphaera sp. F3M07]MBU2916914.1 diguanylate cyclase [Psychrosphaera sp. F3M07]